MPLVPETSRVENGFRTAPRPPSADGKPAQSIQETFHSGMFRYIQEIKPRRFLLVDEERGAVYTMVMFQHPGNVTGLPMWDKQYKDPTSIIVYPNSMAMTEWPGLEERAENVVAAANLVRGFRHPSPLSFPVSSRRSRKSQQRFTSAAAAKAAPVPPAAQSSGREASPAAFSKCARMRATTAGSSMLAMIRSFPPQRAQPSISSKRLPRLWRHTTRRVTQKQPLPRPNPATPACERCWMTRCRHCSSCTHWPGIHQPNHKRRMHCRCGWPITATRRARSRPCAPRASCSLERGRLPLVRGLPGPAQTAWVQAVRAGRGAGGGLAKDGLQWFGRQAIATT